LIASIVCDTFVSYMKRTVKSEITGLYKLGSSGGLEIPFFASTIKAVFPSPAEHYIEQQINLNRDFIKNPDSTFCGRVDFTFSYLCRQ
jgi:SOS-response transcriptional repressor LexA